MVTAVNYYPKCLLIIGWQSFEPTGEGLREADLVDSRWFIVYFRRLSLEAPSVSNIVHRFRLILFLPAEHAAVWRHWWWIGYGCTRALLCVSRMALFPSAQCVCECLRVFWIQFPRRHDMPIINICLKFAWANTSCHMELLKGVFYC